MSKIIIWLLVIIAVTFSVMAWHNSKEVPMGAGRTINMFDAKNVTNSSTTIGHASTTTILARNVGRTYASICAATGTIYLYYGTSTDVSDNTVLGKAGYRLDRNQCYEITPDNLYVGQVFGYVTSSTGLITTLEVVF